MLTIRLSRIGKKKKPFYRVVVIERTRPRDGRVKEAVGTYDPLKKPAEIKLDAERVKYWLGQGAQPSDTVRSFLKHGAGAASAHGRPGQGNWKAGADREGDSNGARRGGDQDAQAVYAGNPRRLTDWRFTHH